jgi:putative DNA primase/helicase
MIPQTRLDPGSKPPVRISGGVISSRAVQDIGNDGKPLRRGFSLVNDIARLDAELPRLGDVVLVIIDPITAYLGAIDSHRNAEVRAVLAPLAELAGRNEVAVLAISHLRKGVAGDAVLQVMGSLAFAAAARAVYIVARDLEDATRRLLLPAKNNISDDRTGYAYRIEPVSLAGGIDTCRIVWEPDAMTVTADEALAPRDAKAEPHKRDAAAEWLGELLAHGPVAVKKLRAEAEAAGYSWATIRRARDNLGTITEKTEFEGGWACRLAQGAAPGEEIEL